MVSRAASSLRIAAVLGAATVAMHIAYPLTDGELRRHLTIWSVVAFAASSFVHIGAHHGLRGMGALLLSGAGVGWVVEAVGVATGVPFGRYEYSGTLGWRLVDVSVVVPLAWAMMAWPALLAGRRTRHPVLTGTAILVTWDLFLDPQMVEAGHWTWAPSDWPALHGIPVSNALGWIVTSVLVLGLLDRLVPRPVHVDQRVDERVPFAMLAWTWASSTLAFVVFFGRPHGVARGGPGDGIGARASCARPARRPAPVAAPPAAGEDLGAGMSRAVRACSTAAAMLSAHTVVNALLLRRPRIDTAPRAGGRRAVSVCIPARDEAARIAPTIRSVVAQPPGDVAEILVLDDGSTDGTADVVRDAAGGDPRVRVLTGAALPPGWLGKPNACQQLGEAARGEVLVFVDADVELVPGAVRATVDLMERLDADLVSPYPRQVAVTAGERLVQPLLQWLWLTFLPLRLAERRGGEPSLSAANGQLLAIRRETWVRVGATARCATRWSTTSGSPGP